MLGVEGLKYDRGTGALLLGRYVATPSGKQGTGSVVEVSGYALQVQEDDCKGGQRIEKEREIHESLKEECSEW